MTDLVQAALVVAIAPTIVAVGGLITLIFSERRASRAEEVAALDRVKAGKERAEAAEAVEKVKLDLIRTTQDQITKLDEIHAVNLATHTLVNGSMTIQLKINVALAMRVYEESHKEADRVVYEQARKVLEEHEASLEAAASTSPDPDSTPSESGAGGPEKRV